MSIKSCTACDYHVEIVNGHVHCSHDEAPLRANIKVLERAITIAKSHGFATNQIEGFLDELRKTGHVRKA